LNHKDSHTHGEISIQASSLRPHRPRVHHTATSSSLSGDHGLGHQELDRLRLLDASHGGASAQSALLLAADRRYKLGCSDEDTGYWDYVFHCTNKTGFHGPLALSHMMLILSFCCLLAGGLAAVYESIYGDEKAPMFWGPWLEWLCLTTSVYGGCLVYVYDFLSDIMVIVGFCYCGYYVFAGIGIGIMVLAQVFAAWEYAMEHPTYAGRVRCFFLALFQARVFVDAAQSWSSQRVTHSFARHKFIEAIGESGPQAILAVYVLYYLDLRYNFWLVVSIFGSVLGLAYGCSVWIGFTFEKQLEEEGITDYCIRWYHHVLWCCYFAMDFGLRLLTIGLFLSTDALKPQNQIIFALLLVVYCLAVVVPMSIYNSEESRAEIWQIGEDPADTVSVRRQVMAQRVIDGLILTFFVHVLPADIRLDPKHEQESRLHFALHPKLRAKIMWVMIPLRATDYILLGGLSMYYKFDKWQCAALVSMFITMHILLYAVLRLKAGAPVVDRKSDHTLPEEVIRAISRPANAQLS